jgi:hypothetical protein
VGILSNTFTRTRFSNPLRRVTPVELIEEGRDQVYYKEKYREMLLEVCFLMYLNTDL